jgi:iron complex transport system substrate-binding protein
MKSALLVNGKALLLSATILMAPALAFAEEKTITDVLGREVTLDLPAERVFLGFYYTDYIAVGGVKSFDHVVGFSRDVWSVWTPAQWDMFRAAMPSLESLADVGEVEAGTFSVEKLLSLNPSVAVLADWQYQALGPDIDRIEEAGIKVVVLDYNAETVERHVTSTEVIGAITGETERAEELSSLYADSVAEVQRRIKEAGREKPRFYVEFANAGPAEYSFTYGKNMWGALSELAGADNIAAPFVEWWGPMNPEQVLASRPEVILLSGRERELGRNAEALVMGVNIDEAEAQRRLKGYATDRAGWAELPAIQNGRLYGVYQGASRTLADYTMVQYIAKILYPDLFEDIDPQAAYIDFHKKYLPILPEGTFTLTLEK